MEGETRIKKSRDKLINYLKRTKLYPRENVTIIGKFIYLFVNYIGCQTVYGIFQKWSVWSFNSKVSAIESLNNNFGTLGLINDLFILSNQTILAIEIIDGKYFQNRDDKSSKNSNYSLKKLKVINETEQKTVSLVDKLEKTMTCFYIAYMLAPIFGILLYFANLQDMSQITLPFMFFVSHKSAVRSPPVFSSIWTLLPVFILESFYVYIQFIGTFICHTVCILTVSNVSLEIDLFCMNVEKLSVDDWKLQQIESCDREVEFNQHEELRSTVRDLVLQHQSVFKKIRAVNKIFLFRLIYGNIFLTIELTLLIFCFQKHPDFVQRIKYGVMMIPLLCMLIAYSEYGQRIENKGEKMRVALHDIPWQNKPKWVQSSLKILMLRSNIDPHITVFNIFNQNRQNMAKLMKLAYSYFNLLDRIST